MRPVARFPAPVYGSRFTIGMIEKIFENFGNPMPDGFELQTITMNEETHERLKIGEFFVELVRITHSIPGSTCVVLDTPVGRIVNTGDFRLDPNPLDHERTDTERLLELGRDALEHPAGAEVRQIWIVVSVVGGPPVRRETEDEQPFGVVDGKRLQ